MSRPEPILLTPRLRLRRWSDADVDGLAALNADSRVMEFLGPPLTWDETSRFVEMIEREWDERGFGLFCVEAPAESAGCVGFVGLHVPTFDAPFQPSVEIGWRLAAGVWGRGLATEGAAAVREFAHGPCGLDEIVSMTAQINVRSRRVMEKIGLVRDPADDFDHPRLAVGDPLRPHVLYRGRAGPR